MAVTKKKPRSKPIVKGKQSSIEKLIAQAINKKAFDAIDMIVGYDRELRAEKAKRSYFTAMRTFQNEVPDLPKVQEATDKNGRHYKFCPLPLIVVKIQPFIYKLNFIYRWDFKAIGEKIECTCINTHIDGHSETASMTADRDDSESMNNLQSIGSTNTYLQRRTLIAVLGLTTAEEDNDGATANTSTKTTSAIPDPQAISKEREALEAMAIEELVLKVETDILDKSLKEKFKDRFENGKVIFTAKEQGEVKKLIIDIILEKK